MRVIVTGGAGFIGSFLCEYLTKQNHELHVIDCLTYAGHMINLANIADNINFNFHEVSILNTVEINRLFLEIKPDIIFHLAAESHVDRSIDDAGDFIQTNINGTFVLLNAAKRLFEKYKTFKFVHVSTDEVFGSLEMQNGEKFTEDSLICPNSPYSASKASSDLLARSYYQTYNLPVIITRCSNNYGPRQLPEKLIPKTVLKILNGEKVPVYGDGMQIRDWVHVLDHVRALYFISQNAKIGQTFCVGGENEVTNVELLNMIIAILQETIGKKLSFDKCCEFVKDRPGHDVHYAINMQKLKDLGFHNTVDFKTGLTSTIKWYLANSTWTREVCQDKSILGRLGNLKSL